MKVNILALIAAFNIGGRTIHSFFSISPGGFKTSCHSPRVYERVKAVNCMLIDEISMVSADVRTPGHVAARYTPRAV